MLKNIGSNWLLSGLQIVVLLYLTRYVVDALDTDPYGVWVTIVSLTGFLSLLILGVPMASVRFIAEKSAVQDTRGTNEAISTCLGICLVLGIAALVIGTGLFFVFEYGYLQGSEWSGLSEDTVGDARIAFCVVVLQVAAGFLMRLPYGILEAHHDFVLRSSIMAGELILRLALTYFLLAWNASLWVLALVQVACMVSEFSVARMVIARRYPHLSFALSHFDRKLVRSVLSFSIFAMVLNVGSMLAFRTDAMVIGAHLESSEVTFFDMGNKFFEPLTTVIIGVSAVVMPMATRLKASGEQSQLPHLLMKWSKICFSLVLLVGLYLLIIGPDFLGWWLGPEYPGRSGPILQVLMLSFLIFLPVRGVALPILLGLGQPGRPALALLVMGAVNVGISILLVRSMGIFGVALGTAIPNVMFAATLAWLTCRELSISTWRFLGYVAGKAVAGALLPLGFLLAVKQRFELDSFLALFVSGLGMVAVFTLVWVVFVYRNDPYVDVKNGLERIRAKLGRSPT